MPCEHIDTLKSRQAIIWTNNGIVYWRIYATSLGLDELMSPSLLHWVLIAEGFRDPFHKEFMSW